MISSDRPSWHIDAKWIFGILTTLFLTISLTLFVASTLTSEKVAVPLGTVIVASQFSRDGLDDPKDIEEFKRKYLHTNQTVFYPLGENQAVKITREELLTLTPKELRLRIFKQVIEPYYQEGVEGVANRVGKTEEERKKIKNEASILGLVNTKTHQTLENYFLISLLPSLICFGGLVFFSYRFGKLVSPAVVFLIVSLFPSVLLFAITHSETKSGPFNYLPPDLVMLVASPLIPPYYFLFFTGLGLLVGVLVIKTVLRLFRKT